MSNKEENNMQISKDMLIGELIQMDELIAPMLMQCRNALPGLSVFSGRESGRGMHGFTELTVTPWLQASTKFWQAVNWEI